MGIDPSKIIFANPVKSVSMLKYAKERGVKYMTFDCISELDRIKEHFPEAKVIIRLRVNDSGADFPLSNKFGVFQEHIEEVLDHAKKLELHLAGTAFHVGGNQRRPEAFRDAIKQSREVFDMAIEKGFKRFNLLDIGGGQPGDVNYDNPDDLFYKMAKGINEALDEFFPAKEFEHIKIISGNPRFNLLATLIVALFQNRVDTSPQQHLH